MCASWSSEFGIYKYKGSVEDFIRLFINSKALLQTLPTINSPPLRSAYIHKPLAWGGYKQASAHFDCLLTRWNKNLADF